MRRFRPHVRTLILVLLLVLLPAGCSDIVYTAEVDGGLTSVGTGQEAQLRVIERDYGILESCGDAKKTYGQGSEYKWKVEPAEGASVENGTFVATAPGSYTVTLVDDSGRQLADPISMTVTGETAGEDPLLGAWSWTGALESNGTLGPSMNAYTYTFVKEGAGYALYYDTTKLCDVAVDGTTVSFTTSVMGSATFTGTLSGTQITGTQDHEGGRWVGPWNATKVQ